MKTEESRELTRSEKTEIRKLVTGSCANYDKEYGCLPLDCECYMLNKAWTGVYCIYFTESVLPLAPALEVSLTKGIKKRLCSFCGVPFPEKGKQAYCSTVCYGKARRKQKREYINKRRGRM